MKGKRMSFLMRFCVLISAVVCLSAFAPSSAEAAKVRKYCQGDNHMHYGSGTGRTKSLAKRAALRAWADFTAFEYGGSYASWQLARFKRISCGRSGGEWSCSVQANPCRRGR